MGNLKDNFYIHDNGEIEIYVGGDTQTVILTTELVGRMNQAIAARLYEPMPTEEIKILDEEACNERWEQNKWLNDIVRK